jgi:hypothetical protein
MATVRLVVNFRVKPGRYTDLLEGLKAVKKNLERLGSKFYVNRVAVGNDVGHLIAVGQHADFAAYAKAASDAELIKLVEAMRNNPNPPWESLTTSLVEEVPQ